MLVNVSYRPSSVTILDSTVDPFITATSLHEVWLFDYLWMARLESLSFEKKKENHRTVSSVGTVTYTLLRVTLSYEWVNWWVSPASTILGASEKWPENSGFQSIYGNFVQVLLCLAEVSPI
ncbi:hypothetical protein HOLleu_07333 [Holothuria leucospilota]|uniref:Uncharacterized protein n=1 Tax=Holothuria leucospilota TaxID=206669 RepID=A0A9Q1CFU5_HOLLE|nr:hypothetical protein HOLleu_07333 [Holothuria leucospilota]